MDQQTGSTEPLDVAAESNPGGTPPSTVESADELTDFFADLMLGRDGVTEGVITHW
jgi:hypothetical protein